MKDLVNDFEVWQDALKKIDLNEGALPIYHGRILRENAKEYQKMQKRNRSYNSDFYIRLSLLCIQRYYCYYL